jgi:hypothetical protein
VSPGTSRLRSGPLFEAPSETEPVFEPIVGVTSVSRGASTVGIFAAVLKNPYVCE